jgi:lipopolysaccharide transport system permease protein
MRESATDPASVTDEHEDGFELVLRPNQGWLKIDCAPFWEFRDLLRLLIRRDFLTRYRQTILGPIWFVLQPLVMAGIFSLVFSRSERLQTSEVPPLLFYLSGLLGWNYFAQALGLVGTTFTNNALLFSKAYFPRLLVPISIVTSGLISMALQLAVFLVFCGYFA